MARNDKPSIDVGAEFAKGIYSNAKLVTNEVQPYFILHKDTIRTFLHEKMALLASQGKLLGLIGIEISLIASLVTATFNEWHGIKGPTIEAAFFLSTIAFGILSVKEFLLWMKSQSSCTVDALTTELGKRGAVIESKSGEIDG
ncbi:MAG: hypothetical protein ABIK82_16420 [Pseudomonadota bacterium]